MKQLLFYMLLNSNSGSTCLELIQGIDPLEMLGTLLGLVYLYYQYIASPRLWWGCLISAVPLIYLNFRAGLLATGILFSYYFIMAVKALFFDKQVKNKDAVLRIGTTPLSEYPRILLGVTALFLVLYFGHETGFYGMIDGLGLPRQEMPLPILLADCISTTLCFLGMWLLSKNRLEQWYAWAVANILFVYMYVAVEAYFLMGMMVFYTLVSFAGLFNWKRLKRLQDSEK